MTYPFQVNLFTCKLTALRMYRQGLIPPNTEGPQIPAFELSYFWKDGTRANGAVLETGSTPPEVSTNQFVNFAQAAGSSCELSGIDGGFGGAALLGVLYAYDGNSGNRTGEIIINGAAEPITFVSTTDWGIWRIVLVPCTLLAGTGNTVKLNSIGNDLGNALVLYVNPNRIPVAAPPPPPPAPAPTPTPAPPPAPTPAPAPPLVTTLQAEDGTLSGGAIFGNTNGPNFTGTGYVDFNLSGGKVTFTNVNGGTGGMARADLRYAYDGNSGPRSGLFRCNAHSQAVVAEGTGTSVGDWNNYVEKTIYFPMTAGLTNTVSFESNGQDWGCLDRIYIIPNTEPPPVYSDEPFELQAEDGVLTNAASEIGNGPGWTGTGYVNFLNASGSKVEFTGINGGSVNQSCELEYIYAYDNNTGTRTGLARVNAASQNLVTPGTGGWNNYVGTKLYFNLLAGPNNTISVETTGQDLANLDKIIIRPGVAAPPVPAPPPPAPPPPSPSPPPPPPSPAGTILDADIFAMANANLPYAQARGGFGCEWDNNKKAGLTGVSDTIGAGYLADHNLATGSLGRNRITKQIAPDDPLRFVIVVRGDKRDGLTASAPRTEIGNWITTSGVIPIKQDFWFVVGIYFSQGFPITNETVLAQWHTNGNSPAGYAGQPFFALILNGQNFRVQQRWNANSILSSANTSSVVHNVGAVTSGWNYFVIKARISPLANDNPYLAMWRAQNNGALSQVIDPVNFPNARLGYTGFDNGDPPWQKFGHYPWGYNSNNNWPDPLTREIFYRCPTYVDDVTSRYLPVDLFNHCRTR